jgi:hypothetical protein
MFPEMLQAAPRDGHCLKWVLGNTAPFCVSDHRPVCVDDKEKSAVATLCINEHFLKISGAQWSARRRARRSP